MKKKIVTGILAHVDSGKTTLSEAMLYETGQIRKLGRVDHKDAFLDTDSIEKERGITIFSKQAVLEMESMVVTLLDTPGHVDFSAEMERSLQVMDYAILVISGSEGVQSHTRTLWKLLEKHQIPVFIFVNKMDLAVRRSFEIAELLKEELCSSIVDFTCEDAKFFEEIALNDENALSEFLENGRVEIDKIINLIKQRKIFPCFFGAALKDEGVRELLIAMEKYMTFVGAGKEFGGRVYKILRDKDGKRLTCMKITSGALYARDTASGHSRDGKPWEEKVTEIRIYSGEKYKSVSEAGQGSLCAVTGLEQTYVGQGLGTEKEDVAALLEPVLSFNVNLLDNIDSHKAMEFLKVLEEEDPLLHVKYNSHLDEISIQLMGRVQMSVLERIIKERFNMQVTFGQGKIMYKETIEDSVYGVGHFEPLRHYAEVHLFLEPLEEGSGVVLSRDLREEILEKNWQRLIMTHLDEKVHVGVLGGFPITDMKITLKGGRAHKKHTEGGDFRQATYRALRQGLMQAKSHLLEPWVNFVLKVPTENLGRAMSDVTKMKGNMAPPETGEEMCTLKGEAPFVLMSEYFDELNNYTKGRGSILLENAGYKRCHNEEEVLASFDYDPEKDLENTPDSVFCEKGSGVIVKWDKVSDYMHVPNQMEEKLETDEEIVSKARKYARTLANDKELMAIFERTYGPIKERKRGNEGKIIKGRREQDEYRAQRHLPKVEEKTGPEYLLVDGYNVIYDWEELNKLKDVDYGAARDALIDIMCNYQGFMEVNLILVFDAYKVKGGKGSIEKIGGINVVYTKEAETADMYIEKVTHEIGRKRNVRVVTSDHLEQVIITGHGARKISSGAFKLEVERVFEAIREYIN